MAGDRHRDIQSWQNITSNVILALGEVLSDPRHLTMFTTTNRSMYELEARRYRDFTT
jgi:hypothetical protein